MKHNNKLEFTICILQMRMNRRNIMRILHAGLAEEFEFRSNLPDQIKSEVKYLITCLIRQMKIPERHTAKNAMNTAKMRRNMYTANKCDEYR